MSSSEVVREAQSVASYNPLAKQKAAAKLSRIPVKVEAAEVLKKPDWIRVRGAPGIYVRREDPFSHQRLLTDGFTGLGKIAALGIKVSRHCTYHGVALNVAMDLQPFSRINPCGYVGLQTVDLSTIGVSVTWQEAADVLSAKLTTYLAP